tara:strand:+ start:269 stop:604 length:336 start_codon:yes stop_codon:yes gene_type:complete
MMKMRDLLRGTYHTMARFHDQRDFERVKVNTAITLYYGKPVRVCEALCVNISKGGMGIMSDQVLPMGTECKVKIHDGQTNKGEYQALIEISRIFELEDKQFFLGARILVKY